MKAIKIYNIHWNIDHLTDEEKEKVMNTIPMQVGFKAEDEFSVLDNVPELLKKKFGYDVKEFSFSEIHVAETLYELLKLCAPKGKEKTIFTDKGNLSAYGKLCKENLENDVKARIQLERKGIPAHEMSKHLDAVMLGVEKLSGLSWNDHTPDELFAPIYRQIWDQKAVNLKDAFEGDEDEVNDAETYEEEM